MIIRKGMPLAHFSSFEICSMFADSNEDLFAREEYVSAFENDRLPINNFRTFLDSSAAFRQYSSELERVKRNCKTEILEPLLASLCDMPGFFGRHRRVVPWTDTAASPTSKLETQESFSGQYSLTTTPKQAAFTGQYYGKRKPCMQTTGFT